MKLNRIGFLLMSVLLGIISLFSFFKGAEYLSIFITSASFVVISLLFLFLGNFKWKDESRQSLMLASDDLKGFLKEFKLSLIGHLFLLWVLLIVLAEVGTLISLFTSIPIPTFALPLIKNVSILFALIGLVVGFAHKRYGQLSIGLFLYGITQLIVVATTYISQKELLIANIVAFLTSWTLFSLFSVYKRAEAPVPKEKKEKPKKEKKKKVKKISEMTEEELILRENAKAVEQFKKQKEKERAEKENNDENDEE